ncbi:MAG TPA: DUF1552 domain-containing protein [Polyangia bacterium]|nr:DUF1552 domain-containing protein [Polyangia bacterium]
MVKRSLSFPRRKLLKAAGLAAAAPALLGRRGRPVAAAAGGSPLRLVCWPLMNGAVDPYFYPGGSDAATLSPITQPLGKYGSLVTFIQGLDIEGASNHYAVRSSYSGGSVSSYTSPDPVLKSVDQLIADSIAGSSPTPLPSVHLGVIPADDIESYHQGQNIFFYSPQPVDYEANPVTAFDKLFGGGAAASAGQPAGADFTSDALDIADAEMNDLGARMVGATSEIQKLALHRDALKTVRAGLAMPMATTMMGAAPLPSVEKLRPLLQNKPADAYKSAYLSDMFDAQLDIMARVLVNGLSRVVTLQAGSADNDMIVPVGRGYPHHVTSHGDQATFSMVQNFYFGKMARLLAALDVPDPLVPGATVLDNTLIVMISECLPVSHSSVDVPALLVGKLGGKIKPGAVIDAAGGTNKTLMATVCKAFGVAPVQFGGTVITEVLA